MAGLPAWRLNPEDFPAASASNLKDAARLDPAPRKKTDVSAARDEIVRKGKFTIAVDGLDAKLEFGKFKGTLISQLAGSREGCGYLDWMLEEDFPEALKEVIRVVRSKFADVDFPKVLEEE